MNIFKFSLSSFFIFLALFLSQATYAATTKTVAPTPTPTPTTKTPGVLVATVNIKSAKIVFQDGKNFKISFTMTNGEGLQTGVKYGIKLFTDDKNQSLVDEKVYDESLTLNENSSISREITYTPPSILDGNYIILLSAKNQSNFPFSSYVVGKIKLTATTKWIQISPESCYLQIVGDKDAKHYTLNQNIEIDSNQSLSLNCSVTNNSDGEISATASFDTRYSGSFGDYAPQSGGEDQLFVFKKSEKKNISMILPKGDIAKVYNVKVSLTDGESYSNSISVGYIIKGLSATIQKVSLDKDYYKAGDKAELSMIWFGSGFDNATPAITVDTTITNSRDWNCANPNTQKITRSKVDPVTKFYIDIKNTCEDPHVKVAIKDSNGTVLDQKEFTFKSNKAKNNIVGTISKKYAVGAVIVLVLIAILGIYLNRKKKINNMTA